MSAPSVDEKLGQSVSTLPREGMMAVVRNRRALITGVQPFDADEHGRLHLVEVEYTDGLGAETDQLLWEIEPGTEVLEPASTPRVDSTPPMDCEIRRHGSGRTLVRAHARRCPSPGSPRIRPPLAAPALWCDSSRSLPARSGAACARDAAGGFDARGRCRPRQDHQAGMILRELDAAAAYPSHADPVPSVAANPVARRDEREVRAAVRRRRSAALPCGYSGNSVSTRIRGVSTNASSRATTT